ncbi:hypothetical protein B0H13DRAFT_1936726 [Mycena leptocephala]|nr:hypothetical protein B0H13DRAFT_1936726 [Mycena leptocephala]
MTLHPNSIRDNAYKVMIYISDGHWGNKSGVADTLRQKLGRQPPGTKAVLFTYRLIVGSRPDYSLSWTRVSAFPAVPNINSSIVYAGYAVMYGDGYTRDSQVVDVHLPLDQRFLTGQAIREVVVLPRCWPMGYNQREGSAYHDISYVYRTIFCSWRVEKELSQVSSRILGEELDNCRQLTMQAGSELERWLVLRIFSQQGDMGQYMCGYFEFASKNEEMLRPLMRVGRIFDVGNLTSVTQGVGKPEFANESRGKSDRFPILLFAVLRPQVEYTDSFVLAKRERGPGPDPNRTLPALAPRSESRFMPRKPLSEATYSGSQHSVIS